MKVVILAGGTGTRLSEETTLRPKPMVEIGDRPILWHIMKLYSSYGLNDFVICLGYRGYMIKEYFANYHLHTSDVTFDVAANTAAVHHSSAEPWQVTLVETGPDTMTGGRLKRVLPYLGDDDFCFTYGDGIADIDMGKLIAFHREQGSIATVTAVQPSGRFGSMLIERTRVTEFTEKPAGDNAWINGGFFVLSPRVAPYLSGDATSWEQEPLRRLAAEGQLSSYLHTGFWQPMDTLRDKIRLQELWESGAAPWKVWEEPVGPDSVPSDGRPQGLTAASRGSEVTARESPALRELAAARQELAGQAALIESLRAERDLSVQKASTVKAKLVELRRSYYLNGAEKKLKLPKIKGFAELAGAAESRGLSMGYDRLYTLWQGVRAAPTGHAVAEVGVYRGGSARFIAETLQAGGQSPRFYVCDTFAGHPRTDAAFDPKHHGRAKFVSTSAEEVADYLSGYPNLELVVGDIVETSVGLADETFGFVHVDVDVYPATQHCLRFFAPRLAAGGVLVLDDYGFVTCPGAKRAADEFIAEFPEFHLFHLLTGQALLVRRGRLPSTLQRRWGKLRSRSEITAGGAGQSIAKAGSSQRKPRAASGT